MAGMRDCTESPKSPVSALRIKTRYCSSSGRSKPQAFRSASTWLSLKVGGAITEIGSPLSRTRKKTISETMKMVSSIWPRRERMKVCKPASFCVGNPGGQPSRVGPTDRRGWRRRYLSERSRKVNQPSALVVQANSELIAATPVIS